MGDLCGEMNKFGRGMSNVARYRIIEALLKGRKTVGELTKIVKLSQPAVSQHLKVLKASELVVDERRGQEVFYDVNTKFMLDLLTKLTKDVKKQKSGKK
jgi:DNA-binding transcriptional ArsR family regulator